MAEARTLGVRPLFCSLALIVAIVVTAVTLRGGYHRTLHRYVLSSLEPARPRQSSGSGTFRDASNATVTARETALQLFSDRVPSLSDASVRSLYRTSGPLEVTADCSKARRLGSNDVTGWSLCLVGPFSPQKPCFAFSFGVKSQWEFENNFASQFHCQVFAFDPTLRSSTTQTGGERVLFFREGLHSTEAAHSPGFTESYLGHLKRLRAENLLVDVLKLAVSDSAWPAIAAAEQDGSLKKVKQLLLLVPASRNESIELMREQLSSIAALHRAGFRLWKFNSVACAKPSGQRSSLCGQFHYINMNFMASSQPSRNPAGSEIPDPLSLLPISKVAGFDELNEIRRQSLGALSQKQLEALYFRLVEQQHVHCPNSRRVGSADDGGWDVCLSGPFDVTKRSPCVAFSFGINNIYEFDDQLADKFKCKVYMFDPSMTTVKDHQRRNTSWFYQTGLSMNNTVDKNGWKMRTLCTLFSELGYADKEIDILKIDVDYWEWVSFEKALEEGCLSRVRQFMFETHTTGLFLKESDYARFIRILMGVFDLGFRTWTWHLNPYSKFYNFHGVNRACCYEHYLINTKLISL